jgi:hypothetical protein
MAGCGIATRVKSTPYPGIAGDLAGGEWEASGAGGNIRD